ncbi:FAD-dependent oxidoreductase [Lacticaseibacillus sp. N501-2]|uniref:FAD-dependent oxidoreductase n=1 Tax=Lacticaseibacillus salsurae TaxID=3367729 RepID=UPI0038B231FE
MSQPKIAWDATYDVIVLGFGGAGATAARFAADAGAKVLLVDAAPLGHEGGNTRYAGQIVGSAADFDEMKTYYKRLQYPLTLDEDMIDTYVDGMVGMSDYFQKYLEIEKPFSVKRDWHHEKPDLASMLPEYPEYAGGDSYDVLLVHDGTFDSAFWKTLREQVTKRADKIDVWFKAPAKHLIQDPTTKAVIGAQIERESVLLNIRANNGVVLATGGFENNQQMIQDYLGAESLQPLGSVYNKGDGVLLGQEVGADLWHMHNYESLGLTVRKPDGTRGKILFAWTAMAAGSAFVVGDDGTRYMNETQANRHGHLYDHGTWRIPTNNVKPYLIFDAAKYAEFAAQKPDWLDSLAHAATLADLADIIDVPAENLEKTRARFDQFANNGEDQAFDRDADTMTALGDGPYYALALRQSMLNTQGGPRRNVRTEVLDTTGNPIPHLYSAGELGGISANQYQGGNNLAECLIFGKIAGMNAARPKADRPVAEADATSGASAHQATTALGSDLASAPKTYSTGEHQYIGRSTAGMGNEIVVRVTYDAGKIENIEVLQQNESGDFGLKAIQQLPDEMVKANSTDVDAVSGASVSSKALKAAVEDALKQAQ